MRWPAPDSGDAGARRLLLSACEPANERRQSAARHGRQPQIPIGQGFDFYVLSLSWSPSYCEAEGEDANPQQCKAARPYAFVVHGLWPQFERGFPEDCQTDEPKVSNETLRTLYDLMPSAGLIRHEWTLARRLHRPVAARLFHRAARRPRKGRDTRSNTARSTPT